MHLCMNESLVKLDQEVNDPLLLFFHIISDGCIRYIKIDNMQSKT